ncbi:MAG TPA: transporter substrate-binding domain-containing protein [Burkholderiales bacterium]|nr:transporter substrate-binding domain-containing protein [Burkholderiales bacterium]
MRALWPRKRQLMAPIFVACLAAGGIVVCVNAAAEPTSAPAFVDLTPEEKKWLTAHPVIRIGAETNYAPYEFQDSRGRFVGVVADYLDIIRYKLGTRFQVNQLPDFGTVENKLRKKELDVVLAVASSSDREEFLNFTKPYLHYVNVIVTRDDYSFVTGLKDFQENRVAVVEGHSSKQLTARVYPNFNVTAYPDLLDGLMAVSTGKTDGLVDDIFPIVYTIRYRQISNLKIATAVEKALQPQGFSVGVRKDWPELVGILDKVLLTIGHEEQREISQKWLSVRYEDKVDYRAIWTAVAVFSTILLAGVFHIRQLSVQRKALLAARAEAEAANRSKDQFLANMSHELRTPLHAILGYADLVRGGAMPEPSRQEALATIASSGRHLLSLINDLLDLSRIRSGHLELNPAPVRLTPLFEEIAAMVRVEAYRKGLNFFLDAPAGLPEIVEADGKRLRQILLNLLGNAIKFTDSGGVTLGVQCVPADDGKVELRVSVQDTGVGISAKDTIRIFAPFEQAEEGQKQESGVGLGLAITRELARLMGGEVGVDSQPGRGSQFRFRVKLPLVQAWQDAVPASDPVIGYWGPRRSILVVDDQEENRRLLQQLLERLGFDVMLAGSGKEAVASALTDRPDLIVMDLRMPGMDGIEAAHAILGTRGLENIFIVAASASSADLERAEADPRTFVTCLRKPFQTRDLLDAIQRPLDLIWRYADAEAAADNATAHAQAHVIAPPRAALEELLELARMGKLVRVEQIALELDKASPSYSPFSRRLYALARGFEEERLVAMLEDCIGATRDDIVS